MIKKYLFCLPSPSHTEANNRRLGIILHTKKKVKYLYQRMATPEVRLA